MAKRAIEGVWDLGVALRNYVPVTGLYDIDDVMFGIVVPRDISSLQREVEVGVGTEEFKSPPF